MTRKKVKLEWETNKIMIIDILGKVFSVRFREVDFGRKSLAGPGKSVRFKECPL